MRPRTLALALVLVAAAARTVAAQEDGSAGSLGESVDRVALFFRTPWGHTVLALTGGLVALRVYYAARSAFSVRSDARLGPPRGFLAGYFARVRLEGLVKQRRYEEAADLLQAHDPGRALEVAELLVKAKKYSRAAAILVANNRLSRAAETYVRAGAFDLAAELYERAGDFAQAEENYLKAGNKVSAARLLARAGKPERAARYYAEAQQPREAAEQLAKAGRKAEAVEQYVAALALMQRAGGLDRGVRPGERNLGLHRLRNDLCDRIVQLYGELGDTEGQVGALLEAERPTEAAEVLRCTGRVHDAARLLVEHDLRPEAAQVLEAAGAGADTKRRLLERV